MHWPFCESKCPYCDFNSHVRERVDEAVWRDGPARLARKLGRRRRPGRTVGSVFFGGGTPSLMAPETAGAVLERMRAFWPVADDLEVTLEANPGSVEAGRFRGFAEAGVNRLSLGVQSFRDGELAFLGRRHDARAARAAALELAHRTFPRVSFDLIYALPGHTAAEWAARLDEALALAGEHLSLYQLTIEPGTAFAPPRSARRLPASPMKTRPRRFTKPRRSVSPPPACPPTRSRTTPGRVPPAGTTWSIGVAGSGSASGPARMAASTRKQAASRRKSAAPRKRGSPKPQAMAAPSGSAACSDPLEAMQERIQTGLRLAEGIPAAGLEPAIDTGRLAHLRAEGLLSARTRTASGRRPAGRQRLDAVVRYLLV